MSPPAAIVDALNSLLEAEYNSIFRFLGEGSPYVSRADAQLRGRLQELIETNHRHASEIQALIVHLGGSPRNFGAGPEDQYLAYLSLKFLLPKIVEAKKLCVHRYLNTIASIGKNPPDDVAEVLDRHLGELRKELADLEKECEKVLGDGKASVPST